MLFRLVLLTLAFASFTGLARGQTTASKIYRGAIGDKHIEMRLNVVGSKVTGTYFYDQFKQDITLEGAYDSKGQLELIEGVKKKKTGRFVCKAEPEEANTDLDCEWSRVDGTGQRYVFLVEQGIRFSKGTQIVPRTVLDRKTKADASYPQVTAAVVTEGIKDFNLLVESLVQSAMKDFQPESIANSNFDTNYNVLLADDDKVSIEMVEYSDVGAAHPNTRLWTINYNLKTNKQLGLGDVFVDGDAYKTAIARYATRDINQRAEKMEIDEAKRNNRQPEKRDEPLIAEDGLPEMNTWGLSTKGLVVYFEFPHVMAVFDKTIVPYSVLSGFLKPDGVVTGVK